MGPSWRGKGPAERSPDARLREAINRLNSKRLDCFVAEFIIGPAEGGTRWLLAMTENLGSRNGSFRPVDARLCRPADLENACADDGRAGAPHFRGRTAGARRPQRRRRPSPADVPPRI